MSPARLCQVLMEALAPELHHRKGRDSACAVILKYCRAANCGPAMVPLVVWIFPSRLSSVHDWNAGCSSSCFFLCGCCSEQGHRAFLPWQAQAQARQQQQQAQGPAPAQGQKLGSLTPPSSPKAQRAGHRRILSDVTHSAVFGVPASKSTQLLQAAAAEASLNKSK